MPEEISRQYLFDRIAADNTSRGNSFASSSRNKEIVSAVINRLEK